MRKCQVLHAIRYTSLWVVAYIRGLYHEHVVRRTVMVKNHTVLVALDSTCFHRGYALYNDMAVPYSIRAKSGRSYFISEIHGSWFQMKM